MQNEVEKQIWKERVEAAIAAYMTNSFDINAGWNILRYAQKGIVNFSCATEGKITEVGGISTAVMFAILDEAKLGLVSFKEV
jgi:hypothetical protein